MLKELFATIADSLKGGPVSDDRQSGQSHQSGQQPVINPEQNTAENQFSGRPASPTTTDSAKQHNRRGGCC